MDLIDSLLDLPSATDEAVDDSAESTTTPLPTVEWSPVGGGDITTTTYPSSSVVGPEKRTAASAAAAYFVTTDTPRNTRERALQTYMVAERLGGNLADELILIVPRASKDVWMLASAENDRYSAKSTSSSSSALEGPWGKFANKTKPRQLYSIESLLYGGSSREPEASSSSSSYCCIIIDMTEDAAAAVIKTATAASTLTTQQQMVDEVLLALERRSGRRMLLGAMQQRQPPLVICMLESLPLIPKTSEGSASLFSEMELQQRQQRHFYVTSQRDVTQTSRVQQSAMVVSYTLVEPEMRESMILQKKIESIIDDAAAAALAILVVFPQRAPAVRAALATAAERQRTAAAAAAEAPTVGNSLGVSPGATEEHRQGEHRRITDILKVLELKEDVTEQLERLRDQIEESSSSADDGGGSSGGVTIYMLEPMDTYGSFVLLLECLLGERTRVVHVLAQQWDSWVNPEMAIASIQEAEQWLYNILDNLNELGTIDKLRGVELHRVSPVAATFSPSSSSGYISSKKMMDVEKFLHIAREYLERTLVWQQSWFRAVSVTLQGRYFVRDQDPYSSRFLSSSSAVQDLSRTDDLTAAEQEKDSNSSSSDDDREYIKGSIGLREWASRKVAEVTAKTRAYIQAGVSAVREEFGIGVVPVREPAAAAEGAPQQQQELEGLRGEFSRLMGASEEYLQASLSSVAESILASISSSSSDDTTMMAAAAVDLYTTTEEGGEEIQQQQQQQQRYSDALARNKEEFLARLGETQREHAEALSHVIARRREEFSREIEEVNVARNMAMTEQLKQGEEYAQKVQRLSDSMLAELQKNAMLLFARMESGGGSETANAAAAAGNIVAGQMDILRAGMRAAVAQQLDMTNQQQQPPQMQIAGVQNRIAQQQAFRASVTREKMQKGRTDVSEEMRKMVDALLDKFRKELHTLRDNLDKARAAISALVDRLRGRVKAIQDGTAGAMDEELESIYAGYLASVQRLHLDYMMNKKAIDEKYYYYYYHGVDATGPEATAEVFEQQQQRHEESSSSKAAAAPCCSGRVIKNRDKVEGYLNKVITDFDTLIPRNRMPQILRALIMQSKDAAAAADMNKGHDLYRPRRIVVGIIESPSMKMHNRAAAKATDAASAMMTIPGLTDFMINWTAELEAHLQSSEENHNSSSSSNKRHRRHRFATRALLFVKGSNKQSVWVLDRFDHNGGGRMAKMTFGEFLECATAAGAANRPWLLGVVDKKNAGGGMYIVSGAAWYVPADDSAAAAAADGKCHRVPATSGRPYASAKELAQCATETGAAADEFV